MRMLKLFCKYSNESGLEPIAILDCTDKEADDIVSQAQNTATRLKAEYKEIESIPFDASPFDLPTMLEIDTRYNVLDLPVYGSTAELIREEANHYTIDEQFADALAIPDDDGDLDDGA